MYYFGFQTFLQAPHSMMPPLIFQIGRKAQGEFKAVLQKIHRQTTVVEFERIHDAALFLQNNSSPSLLLLLQAWPGCFNQRNISALKKIAPLTPLLILLGAAAEGEARTGYDLPNVNRLYINDWNDFHDKQLENLEQNRPVVWSSPLPHEDDEVILQMIGGKSGNSAALRIRLFDNDFPRFVLSKFGPLGNDSEMNRMIAAYFSSCPVMDVLSISSPCHLFADADDSPFEEIFKAVQRLRHRFADADITVYINSPRFHEKIGLLKAGADRILPKPFFG